MSDETNTTESVPAPAGSVFKPHGEEFSLGTDFAAVAAALNLPIEDVAFKIEETAEGKTLSGTPKS